MAGDTTTQTTDRTPPVPRALQWGLHAIKTVGAPTVFAGLLLYYVLFDEPGRKTAQAAALHELVTKIDTHAIEVKAVDARQLALLEAICYGVANGDQRVVDLCRAAAR